MNIINNSQEIIKYNSYNTVIHIIEIRMTSFIILNDMIHYYYYEL